MILNRIKKSTAVGLAVIVLFSTFPKNVSAGEQSTGDDSPSATLIDEEIRDNYEMSNEEVQDAIYEMKNFDGEDTLELFSDDVSDVMKMQFQQKYGTEDTFKLISNENDIKVEVNGFRGIMKITENDEETIINYFESIDYCNDANDQIYSSTDNNVSLYSAVPRPSAWRTQGPDKLNLKVVKGSTRDKIYATNAGGLRKTYTKKTSDWYSGSTKGFYDEIQGARRDWGNCKKAAGSSAEAAAFAVASNFVRRGTSDLTAKKASTALRVASGGVFVYDIAKTGTLMVAYLGHVLGTTSYWERL